MRLLSSIGFLGLLQVSPYLKASNAKPVNPVLVELRIRKQHDLNITSSNSLPLISVKDIVVTDHDVAAMPNFQLNSTTIAILENLLAMHHQKRETSKFQKREALERAQLAKKRENTYKKKKKYKLCDGAFKMFWNALTKQCELCEKDKVPIPKGDKCIAPESLEEKEERGKCSPGMKLDPSVPGQNRDTLNPKCVDKDQRNRCPAGQAEPTPTKNKAGKCTPDNGLDRKCKSQDTDVHKGIGRDGKMKSSCRLTREKESAKQKRLQSKMLEVWDKVTKAKDEREKKEREEKEKKEKEEREEKERKARARRGACLALGTVSFLKEADIQALDELELEGLVEPDDSSHVPDIEIEDWMISLTHRRIATITNTDSLSAGPNVGAVVKLLVKFFKSPTSGAGGKAAKRPTIHKSTPARLFGGPGKGTTSGPSKFSALRNKESDLLKSRSRPEAKDAASKSSAVKNILQSKTFQDCLAVGAGTALEAAATKRQVNSNKYQNDNAGGLVLEIDLDSPQVDNHPSPDDSDKIMILVADETTDAGEGETPDLQLKTFQDNYHRDDRLLYQACGVVPLDNSITLLQTWNGCCKYYDGPNCEPDTGLFKQMDREDGELRDQDNDAVSSY